MNRKFKLFFSLASLCLSIAMLCFGVYSAMSVSYTINGSVSYEVDRAYVNISTTLYLSKEGLANQSSLNGKISALYQEISTNGLDNADLNSLSMVESTKYTDNPYFSVNDNGEINQDFSPKSGEMDINYGSFSQTSTDESAFSYYIVVKIENIGSNMVYVNLDSSSLQAENSIVKANAETLSLDGKVDKTDVDYFVIGMALDDPTKSIPEQQFNYIIKVSNEQTVLETIPGMEFSFDEATHTATLEKYYKARSDSPMLGNGVSLDIPSSISKSTVSPQKITISDAETLNSIYSNELYLLTALIPSKVEVTIQGQPQTMYFANPILAADTIGSILAYGSITVTPEISLDSGFVINKETAERYATTGGLTADQIFMFTTALNESNKALGAIYPSFKSLEIEYVIGDGELTTVKADNIGTLKTAVQSALNGTGETVTIKDIHFEAITKGNDYTVTKIKQGVFQIDDNTTNYVSSLTIPETIEEIVDEGLNVHYYTLAEIYNYSKIDFSSDSTSDCGLGDYAYVVHNLNPGEQKPETRIQESNEAVQYYIYGDDIIALSMTDSSFAELTLEEGTTEIHQGAFAGLLINSANIPSSVKKIGEGAFYGCTNLASVNFVDRTASWTISDSSGSTVGQITSTQLSSESAMAQYLTGDYSGYTWTKNV